MHARHLAPALLAVALAGCGIGISGAPDRQPDGSGSTTIGARALPDATVSAERSAAGIDLRVDPPQAVAAVELYAGTDWASAREVTVTAVASGVWRVPDGVGDALVRVRLGDGSVLESAPGDFVLP